MHQLRSLRRLALGATLAGAALGGVPALASATTIAPPICVYTPATHTVNVLDRSGPETLRLQLVNSIDIAVRNLTGATVPCRSVNGLVTANVVNTDTIVVSGTPEGRGDGYIIDESDGAFTGGFTHEADGFSEIEMTFNTHGVRADNLTVFGTDVTASGITDTIRVGRLPVGLNGAVNYGPDTDVDYVVTGGVNSFTVNGRDGDDVLSATGNPDPSTMARATVPVNISGGAGNDVIAGGEGVDGMDGDAGNDFFLSDGDFQIDTILGGLGFDEALMDANDKVDSVERQDVLPVGRLRLAPHAVSAHTGQTTHLNLSWTHPTAWSELRTVKVRLYDGSKAAGTISVRPRGGRVRAAGSIALASGASRVAHHGKTVSARLALRLPRSLAGRFLRVAVQATDRHGHKQLEPDAGSIRVLK